MNPKQEFTFEQAPRSCDLKGAMSKPVLPTNVPANDQTRVNFLSFDYKGLYDSEKKSEFSLSKIVKNVPIVL